VDDLIARDLRASFNQQLDNQVLSGSGAAGQLLGLRNVVGIEAVSWTSATPTAVELIKRVADAQSRISSALFEPANVVIMHPRRWNWLLTQNDSSSRPLIVPEASGPMNAAILTTGRWVRRCWPCCG